MTLLVALVAAAGCAEQDGRAMAVPTTAAAAGPDRRPTTVVDSIRPIEEEIRRFRANLPEVTALRGGAPSRDELVRRFVAAIERADTAALVPLLLDRAEFGWLYYPHTMYTAKPYELSPSLLWFQMQNLTDRGATRIARRLFGRPLHVQSYRCEGEPAPEGPNRVWSDCRLVLRPPASDTTSLRLFGSIVERGGIYKFVSYSAEL